MADRLTRHLRSWRSPANRKLGARDDEAASDTLGARVGDIVRRGEDTVSSNDSSGYSSSSSTDSSSGSGSSTSGSSLFGSDDESLPDPRVRNANRLYDLDHDADGATIESESTASWSYEVGGLDNITPREGRVSRAELAGVMHDQLKRVTHSIMPARGAMHTPQPAQREVALSSNTEHLNADTAPQLKIPLAPGVLDVRINSVYGVASACVTIKASLIEPDHRGNVDTLLAAKVPVFTSDVGQYVQCSSQLAEHAEIVWNTNFKYNLQPPVTQSAGGSHVNHGKSADWTAIRTHLVVSCFEASQAGKRGGKRFLGQTTVPLRKLVGDGESEGQVCGGAQPLHALRLPLQLRDGHATHGEIDLALQLRLPEAQHETAEEVAARLKAISLLENEASNARQIAPTKRQAQTVHQRRNAEHARRVRQRAKDAAQIKALAERKLFARESLRKAEHKRMKSENRALKSRMARAQRRSSALAASARNLSAPHQRKLEQRAKEATRAGSTRGIQVPTPAEIQAEIADVEGQNEAIREEVSKYKKVSVELSRQQRQQKQLDSMVSQAVSLQGASAMLGGPGKGVRYTGSDGDSQRVVQLRGEIMVLQQTFERLSGRARAAEDTLMATELKTKEAEHRQQELNDQLRLADLRQAERLKDPLKDPLDNEVGRINAVSEEVENQAFMDVRGDIDRCLQEAMRLELEKALCEEEGDKVDTNAQRACDAVQHEIEYFEAQLAKKRSKASAFEAKLADASDDEGTESLGQSESGNDGLDGQLTELEHQVAGLRAALASAERQSRRRHGSIAA